MISSGKVVYSEVRTYAQVDGGYRAWATVERASADGKLTTRTEFGSVHPTQGEALVEALQIVGFEDAET